MADSMRRYVREIADAFAEHNLLTYAAAFAFQGLVALVPMTLLGLGMLGATGHREVWTQHIAPAIEGRVTPGVFRGIDETVRRILDHGTAGLIAFSVVLSIWYLTAAMRAVMEALNRRGNCVGDRPRRLRSLSARRAKGLSPTPSLRRRPGVVGARGDRGRPRDARRGGAVRIGRARDRRSARCRPWSQKLRRGQA